MSCTHVLLVINLRSSYFYVFVVFIGFFIVLMSCHLWRNFYWQD